MEEYSQFKPILYTPAFTEFIRSLLKRSNLNERNIATLTSDVYMDKFRTAFTHKSISIKADVNYELLEIVGDGIINMLVVRYIRSRFPKVVNVMWITKLKHFLISKSWLSKMAEKYGFYQYLWISDKLSERFQTLSAEEKLFDLEKDGYMSVLEDTMEAFIGALVENIDDMKGLPGPGYTIATSLLFSFFDESNISLDYDLLFDPKTRIKEIFERKGGFGPLEKKWNFKDNLSVKRDAEGNYVVELHGYPKGDKQPLLTNRLLLAKATHAVQLKAEFIVAAEAIKKLKEYGITEKKPNPEIRINK